MGGMRHVDMRKLPAAAQEERRRQVIGLRQAGMTHDAIAAQVGLTPTGVFDICKRYAGRGAAGLKSGPRGPEPGYGRLLGAGQEAETRDLIRRHMPDGLGLPFALWSRPAVRELIWQRFGVRLAVRTTGTYPTWRAGGLHGPEAAAAGLRAGPGGGPAVAAAGTTRPSRPGPGPKGAASSGATRPGCDRMTCAAAATRPAAARRRCGPTTGGPTSASSRP